MRQLAISTPKQDPKPTVCCLVPRELAEPLIFPLRRLYEEEGVEVIVERRNHERRREGDRREDGAGAPAGEERRTVHSFRGRRVGDRRAKLEPIEPPLGLPEPARPYADQVRFIKRRPLSAEEEEDLDTGRLVIALQRGTPGAFDQIYERYVSRIYGYMRIALRDPHEAEDAAHDIFVRVLEAIPEWELRDVPFRVWLFRVVRNYTLSELERRHRVEVTEPSELNRLREEQAEAMGEIDPNPVEAQALHNLSDSEVMRLVARLPIPQRQVVLLRHVMDFSVGEVAEILGRSPNAISQLQQRAFKVLAKRLTALGHGPEGSARPEPRLEMQMRPREDRVLTQRKAALAYSY